jgi:P4 family phage/plasmid primase-like protien
VTTNADRFKKATSWYASNSWEILPCHGIVEGRCTCGQSHMESKDIGKHPAINAWNIESSSDIAKVHTWWDTNPEYNIGVNCRASGFLVIDIDPRSGGDVAYDKFEAYVEGALPPTVEATTGQYEVNGRIIRGRHLFYKCDENEDLIGNLSKLGFKGIDVKHNGYVLISPSRHFSGITYEWVEGKEPWTIPMAEAPEELLIPIRKRGKTFSNNKYQAANWGELFEGAEHEGDRIDVEKILEEGIDEGERATTIFRLACSLANKMPVSTAVGHEALVSLMIRFNGEKVRPPMDLQGPNSVIMHTERAIKYVLDNPIVNKMYPSASDYARNMVENTEREQKPQSIENLTAITGVVYPGADHNSNVYSSFDEDIYSLPGTIGGNVSNAIKNNKSLEEASTNRAMGAVFDVDAVAEEDRGDHWKGRSLTDTGNGRRLIDSFGQAVRYTPGLGWFVWSNGFWKPDIEELHMQEVAKKLGSLIASEEKNYDQGSGEKEKIWAWAALAKSESRLKAAVKSANSDPRITTDVEKWDQDPNLVGVLNGVVDLRTGDLLQGRPDLYITKRAPVAYTKGMTNTRWQQFLDFATDGDKEYQDWLQRAAGYSMSGHNQYDLMFLVYGPAGSGKNTLVESIVKCLGSSQYAYAMDSGILAADGSSNHNTDLYHWAEMRGRRLAWVDELPDNERLKENSVKKLTGSEEITARSPGGRPFTFKSQIKVWVTTNHRPIITDDAMWRRIRPIPMLKIPEHSDPTLKEYLFDPEGGLPAIFSWAVEGAIKVLGSSQRDGLGWCKVVSEAAEMYRKNEDRIALFLDEETIKGEGTSILVKALFYHYRNWSEERGERPLTQIGFDRKLRERNLSVEGSGAKAVVHGMYKAPAPVPTNIHGDVNWMQMGSNFR